MQETLRNTNFDDEHKHDDCMMTLQSAEEVLRLYQGQVLRGAMEFKKKFERPTASDAPA